FLVGQRSSESSPFCMRQGLLLPSRRSICPVASLAASDELAMRYSQSAPSFVVLRLEPGSESCTRETANVHHSRAVWIWAESRIPDNMQVIAGLHRAAIDCL